mmetsp:Transcript_31116/g.78103  ORF Transcript_31116/g.78103 Transcript_31116/m.78103 type:complete len:284 (+) Transcript_31116:677-1528(+)
MSAGSCSHGSESVLRMSSSGAPPSSFFRRMRAHRTAFSNFFVSHTTDCEGLGTSTGAAMKASALRMSPTSMCSGLQGFGLMLEEGGRTSSLRLPHQQQYHPGLSREHLAHTLTVAVTPPNFSISSASAMASASSLFLRSSLLMAYTTWHITKSTTANTAMLMGCTAMIPMPPVKRTRAIEMTAVMQMEMRVSITKPLRPYVMFLLAASSSMAGWNCLSSMSTSMLSARMVFRSSSFWCWSLDILHAFTASMMVPTTPNVRELMNAETKNQNILLRMSGLRKNA